MPNHDGLLAFFAIGGRLGVAVNVAQAGALSHDEAVAHARRHLVRGERGSVCD
jgi:hypothetical protein